MSRRKPSFSSDYTQGCHPSILETLARTNMDVTAGYGLDPYCESARDGIKRACACPEAAVHFLLGGTQTNATVIHALLGLCEGVIAAETGHIATHEAGAIEAGGHKVIALPSREGKIDAAELSAFIDAWDADDNHDHTVAPGMVYISQPTEYGTLYSLDELKAISDLCRWRGMRLYVDGARLAYALATPSNDVSLADLARLADAFYIGGTKCGALLGEAVVFPDPHTCPRFFSICKAHGALLAKGRVLGIQFDCLFADGLYERIGKPAVEGASRLRGALARAGIPLAVQAPTNQVFALLTDEQATAFDMELELGFWERVDASHVVMRFATSWATTEAEVDAAVAAIERVAGQRLASNN